MVQKVFYCKGSMIPFLGFQENGLFFVSEHFQHSSKNFVLFRARFSSNCSYSVIPLGTEMRFQLKKENKGLWIVLCFMGEVKFPVVNAVTLYIA